MSDQNTHLIKSDFRPHHLELMEEDTQESATIYQLRASMNKKLSPDHQSSQEESSSPEAAQELRKLLQRLVEIDIESRDLLRRVSSLLDKDERLEHYMKERIEDPKASRMWQLIEQVLIACQDEERSSFDEYDSNANPSAAAMDKAIKGNAAEETKPYRFKVRNLTTNAEGEQGINSTTGTSTTATTTTTTTTTSEEKNKGN